MNSNFNRQFILTDFRLLENRDFLRFIGSSEYATYLVLRRYVWRSEKSHYMGLHDLYLKRRLLACSLERDKISQVTGVDPDNISRHLTSLAKRGIIKRIRTGRQNIYVLGEWLDVRGDRSYREHEWFYLDGNFGIPKSDLTPTVSSDPSPPSGQTRPKPSDNNRETNREENTVPNGLKQLPDRAMPDARIDYLAQEILNELGDQHSEAFYRLVARKVPEHVIRQSLSEIKADGAREPAKVFTYRMNRFALEKLKQGIG